MKATTSSLTLIDSVHFHLFKSDNSTEIISLHIDGIDLFILLKFISKGPLQWCICQSPVCSNSQVQIDTEQKFLNELINILIKRKIHFILPTGAFVLFNSYPDNSEYIAFGSYRIDLAETEESLFSKLHSKHRNVIRRAEKKGVVVISLKDNVKKAYELYRNSQIRTNNNYCSETIFNTYIDNLKDNVLILSPVINNIYQGVAVIPYDSKSGYYLWGGSIDKPETGSMNLLQWEIIKILKSKNVKIYDLVGARLNPDPGSKFETLQRFKKRFGGELYVGFLWKYIFNKPMYNVYRVLSMMSNLRRGILFKGDIIEQEKKRGNS